MNGWKKNYYHRDLYYHSPLLRFWRYWQIHQGIFFFILNIIIFLIFTLGLTAWIKWQPEMLSPISNQSSFRFISKKTQIIVDNQPLIIYGFLPYWNIAKTKLNTILTHLAYFSLTLNANGQFNITQTNENNQQENDQGLSKLKSDQLWLLLSKYPKIQLELVITQFRNSDIEQFLTNAQAQDRFFKELDSVLLAFTFNGVNIDIEYSGDNSKTLRPLLTQFLKKLKLRLRQYTSKLNLSIDMYAGAGRDNMIWEITEIGEIVDFIIVMGYDFHRANSPQAGPVSPLLGGSKDDLDIHHSLSLFLKKVSKQKIILALPFYGYGWRVTNDQNNAYTYPNTGKTWTAQQLAKLLDQSWTQFNALNNNQQTLEIDHPKYQLIRAQWDENSLTPYLNYQYNQQNYLIHTENQQSLNYKIDYVKQLGLAGIAIWSLGYEDQQGLFWQSIAENINRK